MAATRYFLACRGSLEFALRRWQPRPRGGTMNIEERDAAVDRQEAARPGGDPGGDAHPSPRYRARKRDPVRLHRQRSRSCGAVYVLRRLRRGSHRARLVRPRRLGTGSKRSLYRVRPVVRRRVRRRPWTLGSPPTARQAARLRTAADSSGWRILHRMANGSLPGSAHRPTIAAVACAPSPLAESRPRTVVTRRR